MPRATFRREDFKELDVDTAAKKIKANELAFPPRGPEREEFIEILKKPVDDPDRLAYFGGAPASPEPSADVSDDTAGADDVVPPAPAGDDDTPSDPPVSDDVPASLDEMRASYAQLSKALAEKDAEIHQHRSSNGRLGSEMQALKKRIAELEAAKPSVEVVGDDPSEVAVPQMPDADDYDDGLLDPKYRQDMKKFNADMRNYHAHITNLVKQKPAALPPEFEETREILRELKERDVRQQKDSAWSGVWKDIDDFQAVLNVKSTVPIKDINEQYLIKNNPSQHSPEAVAAAARFIDSVPKNEMAFFEKIAGVVNNMYDFSGVTPQKVGYKTIRAYVVDNGLESEFGAIQTLRPSQSDKERAVAKTQQARENTATVPPAAGLGAGDDHPSPGLGEADKVSRYRELGNLRLRDPRKFDAGPNKVEFDALRAELVP